MAHQVNATGAVGEGLIANKFFAPALERAADAVAVIAGYTENNTYAHLTLARETADLAGIEDIATRIQKDWDNLVVLGTGGSSLGAQALLGLTHPQLPGPAGIPNIFFLDNLDGDLMASALDRIDLERCGFLVISKSGSTTETIAQMQAAMTKIIALGGDKTLDQHFVIITEDQDNPLRAIAAKHGLQTISHASNLGGRFSVLSNVGLIPAAVAGLDIRALRQGAGAALEQFLNTSDVAENPAAAGGALMAAAYEAGKNINVMFAYGERLRDFGRWFQQLWSESIGKDGKGSTPVFAAGPVDQHSQLQLYADGPKDKLFTFITSPTAHEGPRLEMELLADERLRYLAGHHIGDIVAAEAEATLDTLRASGHPVREIRLEAIDETNLGALLMHFMLETEVAAHILGVDAYGQPGVEAGKLQMRDILSS